MCNRWLPSNYFDKINVLCSFIKPNNNPYFLLNLFSSFSSLVYVIELEWISHIVPSIVKLLVGWQSRKVENLHSHFYHLCDEETDREAEEEHNSQIGVIILI